MSNASVVNAAFRQFLALIDADQAAEHLQAGGGLAAYLARLPWDEKLFKVEDGPGQAGGGRGRWLACVRKSGPELVLTPTTDPDQAPITVRGRRFWDSLLAALAAHAGPPPVRHADEPAPSPDHHGEPPPTLALNRWNRSAVHRWTQRNARRPQAPAEDTTAEKLRQTYAVFYE